MFFKKKNKTLRPVVLIPSLQFQTVSYIRMSCEKSDNPRFRSTRKDVIQSAKTILPPDLGMPRYSK